MPTASAAAPTLIDYAMRQIPAQDIRAAGHSGVINLCSTVAARLVLRRQADHLALRPVADHSRLGDRQQLSIRKARRDRTVGLHAWVRRSADARTAWSLHTAAGGGRSAPIFFQRRRRYRPQHLEQRCAAIVSRNQLGARSAAHRYLRGCRYVGQWATADGVIGRSRSPGHVWAWQTRSWSRSKIYPAAVLYQRIVSTVSNPGPVVGGIPVDVSDVLAQDCGQWNLHP